MLTRTPLGAAANSPLKPEARSRRRTCHLLIRHVCSRRLMPQACSGGARTESQSCCVNSAGLRLGAPVRISAFRREKAIAMHVKAACVHIQAAVRGRQARHGYSYLRNEAARQQWMLFLCTSGQLEAAARLGLFHERAASTIQRCFRTLRIRRREQRLHALRAASLRLSRISPRGLSPKLKPIHPLWPLRPEVPTFSCH